MHWSDFVLELFYPGFYLESMNSFFRLGVICSFFVPFYLDVPRITRTSILGIPITGKSLVYITALQVNIYLLFGTL